ncbi:hypothetical protein BDV93DRAFT_508050 [Ceratobasidium sp. AG-I]|nr:hypothetical protein BDV93DRAFT_508050 [Ceratobasidium sp. AG-I]
MPNEPLICPFPNASRRADACGARVKSDITRGSILRKFSSLFDSSYGESPDRERQPQRAALIYATVSGLDQACRTCDDNDHTAFATSQEIVDNSFKIWMLRGEPQTATPHERIGRRSGAWDIPANLLFRLELDALGWSCVQTVPSTRPLREVPSPQRSVGCFRKVSVGVSAVLLVTCPRILSTLTEVYCLVVIMLLVSFGVARHDPRVRAVNQSSLSRLKSRIRFEAESHGKTASGSRENRNETDEGAGGRQEKERHRLIRRNHYKVKWGRQL